MISSLDSINKVIGIELLSQSLLPAIAQLAQDAKWRVRLVVIEHLPMLAKYLGKEFFLMERDGSAGGSGGTTSTTAISTDVGAASFSLMQLSVNWLSDEVFQIRKVASENLYRLGQLFGLTWTTTHILPAIQKLKISQKYSQRLTVLHAVQVLLKLKGDGGGSSGEGEMDVVYKALLRVVFDLSSDTVPNIRLNVAKTLLIAAAEPRLGTAICKCCLAVSNSKSRAGGNVYAETFDIIDKLLEDQDRDVRFYAKKVIDFYYYLNISESYRLYI